MQFSLQDYFLKGMPWLTLPWEGTQEQRNTIARKFAVVSCLEPYWVFLAFPPFITQVRSIITAVDDVAS